MGLARRVEVPAGTKVWPVRGTTYRSWVGKPITLNRSVTESSMGYVPIGLVLKFPRFADTTEYRWVRFNKTIREKGKPKKSHVLGFIYPLNKAIIHD